MVTKLGPFSFRTPAEFWQKVREIYIYGKIFLVIVAIEVVIIALMQIIELGWWTFWIIKELFEQGRLTTWVVTEWRLYSLGGENQITAITYALLLLITEVFFIYFAFDGIYSENTFEIFGFNFVAILYFAFSVLLIITSILQGRGWWPLYWFFLFLTFVTLPVYFFLSWKIYREVGWRIYKKIGASKKLRTMYRWYQIMLFLMKLDIMIVIILTSIVIPLRVFYFNDYELYIAHLLALLSIVWIVCIWFTVRREWRIIFFFLMFLAYIHPGYLTFKAIKFLNWRKYHNEIRSVPVELFICLTIIACIMRFLLIFVLGICFLNFNRGLRKEVFDLDEEKREKERGKSRERRETRLKSLKQTGVGDDEDSDESDSSDSEETTDSEATTEVDESLSGNSEDGSGSGEESDNEGEDTLDLPPDEAPPVFVDKFVSVEFGTEQIERDENGEIITAQVDDAHGASSESSSEGEDSESEDEESEDGDTRIMF